MADTNKILTAEEEQKLLEPIEAHINEIQKKIDALRVSGTDEVIARRNHIQLVREDKNISKDERPKLIEKDKAAIAKAAEIEKKNKPEVDRLIAEGEAYLKEHFDRDFFNKVKDSCAAAKAEAQKKNQALVNQITKEHQEALSKLTDKAEIKDENYVYKNKLFDAKMRLDSELQDIKSRQHDAFSIRYHYIDMLRLSRFTFAQNRAQKWENYKYNFNVKQFFLKNGLYIVIVLIFIMLGIITPIVKHTSLFTMNNILNILQQASPRMFLALGVAGLIRSAWAWLQRQLSCTRESTPVPCSDIFLISPACRRRFVYCWRLSCASSLRPALHRSPASSPRSSRCIRLFRQWRTC